MATVKVSTEMRAPVEQVFALFTDIEHGTERVSGIKRIEVLTTGPFGLGTRWRETREVLGRLDDAEMEVTSFELNRQYTVTHHKAGVRIDTEFTFEPIPGGTCVSIGFGLNSQGLPPGLLSPLEWAIAGKVRDVLSHDLADLKASIRKLVEA
jgi:Polyketide cyclase / dehydrase and lipid transport